MRGMQLGLFFLTATCTALGLNAVPLDAKAQAINDEQKNGSLFYQCRKKIEEKESAGCISHSEALKLSSDLFELQKRDFQYIGEHYRASHNRDDYYRHDQSMVSQAQAIMNSLDLQTSVNEQWKGAARDRSQGVSRLGQKPWPPRDQDGQIIFGPKRGGTAEQVGWPMYGWSGLERSKYFSGGKVRITSKSGNFVFGALDY